MRFTKMHGAGNDYVYVNCFEKRLPDDLAQLAIAVSDRHKGIGSDGLILIRPSTVADARMQMFNADGSEAEMCGNGVRCVAKYVYDHGIARKETLRIETGPRHPRIALLHVGRQGDERAGQHGPADPESGRDPHAARRAIRPCSFRSTSPAAS